MDIINDILNTHRDIETKDRDKLNTIHNTIESHRLEEIAQISVKTTPLDNTLKIQNKE